MNIIIKFLLSLFLTVLFLDSSIAQDDTAVSSPSGADTVFARQGEVELTRDELYGAISRVQPELRLRFVRDGARVDTLVKSLLRTKLIAADAAKSGFDQEAMIRSRMNSAAEKELAEAWIQNLITHAEDADYEALAREYYLAHPDDFKSMESVDVSHILIKSDTRSEEEALDIANTIRDDLRSDPSQFDSLIVAFSEDPAKDSNLGRYPSVQKGQMVEPFEEAVFSMEESGEISDPVKTSYGYHIIRMNRIMPSQPLPFDQVRQGLVLKMEEKHLSDYRVRYIQKMVEGSIELSDGAAEALVEHYFDGELPTATSAE
jgi:peptidyl-prolyl cis-trans isomerase C